MQRRKHLNEKLISKWEINIKSTFKKSPISGNSMSTFKWGVYLRSHNKENKKIFVTEWKWKENLPAFVACSWSGSMQLNTISKGNWNEQLQSPCFPRDSQESSPAPQVPQMHAKIEAWLLKYENRSILEKVWEMGISCLLLLYWILWC